MNKYPNKYFSFISDKQFENLFIKIIILKINNLFNMTFFYCEKTYFIVHFIYFSFSSIMPFQLFYWGNKCFHCLSHFFIVQFIFYCPSYSLIVQFLFIYCRNTYFIVVFYDFLVHLDGNLRPLLLRNLNLTRIREKPSKNSVTGLWIVIITLPSIIKSPLYILTKQSVKSFVFI